MDDSFPAERTLAIDGGRPVRNTPLPSWPLFDDVALAAVVAVLRSGKVNYWTGTQGRRFEHEFAQAVGCRYGVATSSGTVALEAALAALEVAPGDEVIVPSRTFVASASCCAMRGAVPVFADVDPASGNITAETIRAVLSPRSKAIIAVHLAGWPCEMDPIVQLAARHRLRVIEDCAQAHGAEYKGRPVGSLGHLAAFSFCQDKILTTGGEGGMVTTNDADLRQRAWSFKDHGKSFTAAQRPNPSAVFQWLHESFGGNGRMTEMQAAIGRDALRKLSGWLAARRKHAAMLDRRLGRLAQLCVARPPDHLRHAYYKYHCFLRHRHLGPGWTRDRVVRAIRAEGVPCGSGSCSEVYLEKAFANASLRPLRRHPAARKLGETSLMFPVHPTLTHGDVLDMCRAVEKVLRVAAIDTPVPMLRAA